MPRFCATLWTLQGYPTPAGEWTIERKIAAIAEAGFEGIHDSLTDAQIHLARRNGLEVVGRLDGRFADSWQDSLQRQIDQGITLFNTHLGQHSTPPTAAAATAAAIFAEGRARNALVQFETHRDTATETPEKYDALARHFLAFTGHPLPTTWDHSHFAVMKHLLPETRALRLLGWRAEIQASQLFHCRPFNGQHAQLPVTGRDESLTPEFEDYLTFARELFQLWQDGPPPRPRLWICPEMGASEGYHLSNNPFPWLDAIRCRQELEQIWT